MDIKPTITTMFLLPLLKIPKEVRENNNFINGYIMDAKREDDYENVIYLLFHPDNIDRFREFLDNEYERTNSIIEDYDYSGGFIVVIYQLDVKYKTDIELIKQGKYSKTSKAFQNLIPKVTKIMVNGLHRDEVSMQYRVFNKTQDLVTYWEERFGLSLDANQELWSTFNLDEETLNYDKIKEHVN